MAPHEVVILGGSFAGLNVVHELEKKWFPQIAKSTGQKFHITLISLSSHLHFSVAVPRAVVDPSLIPLSALEVPIQANIPYSADSFNFIHGKVTSLDYANRSVQFTTLADDYKETGSSILSYDSLFIALGSHTKHPAFKLRGSHDEMLAELDKLNKEIAAAASIVIAGGGPVAIETMGEIASKYGKSKALTVFTNGPSLLHNVTPDIGTNAKFYLEQMGVHVGVDARVSSATKLDDGKTRVSFGKGESVDVDLYIDATGVIPNSDCLPKELLDENGFLVVDAHQRVTKAGPLVYGIGDITGGWTQIVKLVFLKPIIISNWAYEVSGGKVGKEAIWETPKNNMMIAPVGRKKAVFTAFGWRLPSIIGWLIKGRTYMIDKALANVKVGA